jgi:hypothetical protein
MNPRTLWGCQSVAFILSLSVAPPARLSRSITRSVLVPWRALAALFPPFARLALLAPFFTAVAFFPDLAFDGATARTKHGGENS